MQKILLIICTIVCHNSIAQNIKTKPVFKSINSFGTAWGSSQNVTIFETINGVSYKKWSVGLGVAFDGYGQQSTPVFLDVRKTINKKSNLFVYADAGLNIPWRTTNFPKNYEGTNTAAFTLKNTFYGEVGIGLKTPLNTSSFLFASIGYSYKTFSYQQHNINRWWGVPANFDKSEEFEFYYKRIALRLGVEF